MDNSEKSAFPEPYLPDLAISIKGGLTKREYFAGLAMQSIATIDLGQNYMFASEIAKRSVILADELLKQLEK